MAEGHSWCYVTTASAPPDGWARLQPMLESWKGALQDLPGYMGADTMARRADSDTLRFHVRVTWLCREQLEEFIDSPWETEKAIAARSHKLFDVHSDIYENFI